MVKIHACCGKRKLEGWFHADMAKFDHIDHHDIFNLPFENNSIDEIYCAHGLSYMEGWILDNLLAEWKRVLKPEGILRLAVPDFGAMAKMYIDYNLPVESLLGLLYGKMVINGFDIIFHKKTYDLGSLTRQLEENGFKDVQLYDWQEFLPEGYDDHSRAYLPPFDFEHGTLMSLNIQCRK